MSTVARRRASTAQRRWVEAGTTGAEGGRLEEEVHPEEEVMMVIGTVSRCMMGRLRPAASAPPPCRGWTWRLSPRGSVRGRTDREPETPESESPRGPTEVAPLRGRMGVTVHLSEAGEEAGVLEEDQVQDRSLGEEDPQPEDHRGGVAEVGRPKEINSRDPPPIWSSHPCWPPTGLRPSPGSEPFRQTFGHVTRSDLCCCEGCSLIGPY